MSPLLPRGQRDLSEDKHPEQFYWLLPHLVMPESQPSLKRDGATVSSSSVTSCRNREPGRAVSSSLGSTGAAACPFGKTKVTLTVTAPLWLPPYPHQQELQGGTTAQPLCPGSWSHGWSGVAAGVSDRHTRGHSTAPRSMLVKPLNTHQNALGMRAGFSQSKGSQRGRSTAGALAGAVLGELHVLTSPQEF